MILVMMFTHRYLPHPFAGGAETQIHALAPLLAERGVEVHLITRQDPGLLAEEQLGAVHVYRAPMAGHRSLDALSYLNFAVRKARQIQPDILHAHHLRSPASAGLLAAHLQRIPLVVKLLGGGESGDINRLNQTWSGRARLGLLKAKVDRFIWIGACITAELEAIGVGQGQQIRLPNGVDVSRFLPLDDQACIHRKQALGLAPGLNVLFSGRLISQKRLPDLLSAWQKIHHHHPEANLLIAGAGPEAESLTKLAGPQVCWLGYRRDIDQLLPAVDLFVLPSISEGLSNALLEAMASGIACLASDIPGNNELISDDVDGRLFAATDVSALAQQIDDLLQSAEQRQRLGLAARQRVVSHFSLEATATQLHTLYLHHLRREAA